MVEGKRMTVALDSPIIPAATSGLWWDTLALLQRRICRFGKTEWRCESILRRRRDYETASDVYAHGLADPAGLSGFIRTGKTAPAPEKGVNMNPKERL